MMNKKILLMFVMSVFLIGFVMAIAVQENQEKTFSFGGEEYSVSVSEASESGEFEVEVNGEKIEGSMEGDSIVINGVELKIDDIKKPSIFRQKYKVKIKAEDFEGEDFEMESESEDEEPDCSGTSATISEGSSTAIVAGHAIDIDYISSSETKLNVDGETTNALSEGESVILDNSDSLKVLDIMYGAMPDAIADVISQVEICVSDGSTPIGEINANSCKADAICEISKTISTVLGSKSALILTSDAKRVLIKDSLELGNLFFSEKTISTVLGSKSALILTSDAKRVLIKDANLEITALSGTGNAYVCVSSGGKIYRSATACVDDGLSQTELDSQTDLT